MRSKFIYASALSYVALSACSAPTSRISWQEEVEIAAGKSIWIQRTDYFKNKSEPGNPLKSAMWLDQRVYEIDWNGQHYTYKTQPGESMGALMIRALGDGSLVVIDTTKSCEKPGYAEFRWIGGQWRVQGSVSSELMDQPRNLMNYYNAERPLAPRVSTTVKLPEYTGPTGPQMPMKLEQANLGVRCATGNTK